MKELVKLIPFLICLTLTIVNIVYVKLNDLLFLIIALWCVVLLVWFVLFLFRLFKRFRDKLVIHVIATSIVAFIAFSCPIVAQMYQSHSDKMEASRWIAEVNYASKGSCLLGESKNLIPHHPSVQFSCSVANPTRYEFDTAEFYINVEKGEKVVDSEIIVVRSNIPPHKTKYVVSWADVYLPKNYKWHVAEERYRLSDDSWKKWKEEILKEAKEKELLKEIKKKRIAEYKRSSWWNKPWFYINKKSNTCEKVVINNQGYFDNVFDSEGKCKISDIENELYDFNIICGDSTEESEIYGDLWAFYNHKTGNIYFDDFLPAVWLYKPSHKDWRLKKQPKSFMRFYTDKKLCIASLDYQRKIEQKDGKR